MRRLVMLTMALALIGCQSTTATTDRNARPKQCDDRAVDSGLCVPGEYDSE